MTEQLKRDMIQTIATRVITKVFLPLILENKYVIEYLDKAKKTISEINSRSIDEVKCNKLMQICSQYSEDKNDTKVTYTGKKIDSKYGPIKLLHRHEFSKAEIKEINSSLQHAKAQILQDLVDPDTKKLFHKLANCKKFAPCSFSKNVYLSSIGEGSCPKRNAKESKGEALCRAYVLILTGKLCNTLRPDWMRNPLTKRPLELDIYNVNDKYAFEVNGKHHYENVVKENNQIWRDSVKHHVCNQKGIKLIDVPYCIKHELLGYAMYLHLKDVGAI